MKFIHYLEKVSGVSIYGLLSMSIFVLFFIVVLFLVFRTDKEEIKKMSRLPLDN